MAYEVFEKTAVRVDQPALSLVPDGRIALNTAAIRTLRAAGIKSVLLLWDKTERKIALKAASARDRNAYAVSGLRDGHSASMRCKPFLTYIGWNSPKRILLEAVWNDEEKMLETTLPKEHLGTEASEKRRTGKTVSGL